MMQRDILDRQSGNLRGQHTRAQAILVTAPDAELVTFQMNSGVHDLHRRMGQVRNLVACFDNLAGPLESSIDVTDRILFREVRLRQRSIHACNDGL